jgi:peptidoglycan hydrolase-like protein with peptidoglycan-binding domain
MPASIASCGVQRIDNLLGVASAAAITAGEADAAAVSMVQDFLTCHGYRGLPGPLSTGRGAYGPKTTQCVRDFQQSCGLPVTGNVDQATLRAFIARPAETPVASQGYLTLVLGVQFTGMTRLTSITAQFEGAGRFGAINRNTDKAGLSYGLIQWAQKPLRLNELLRAFRDAEPQRFPQVFAGGDQQLAQRLIAHTAKPRGGTNDQGQTTDPAFDLINEPWLGRFRQAAQDQALQRVQLQTATAAFEASRRQLREYAPGLRTEREIAFMLDLANQHGDGGAKSIFLAAGAQLLAMEKESVKRVAAQYGAGSDEVVSTQARRAAFRTSGILADVPV